MGQKKCSNSGRGLGSPKFLHNQTLASALDLYFFDGCDLKAEALIKQPVPMNSSPIYPTL